MLKTNISQVFEEIKNGNNLGEKITVVGATKTVDVNVINDAVKLGVNIVGDNKVQEFRDKSPFIKDATFHFIGHLQKNKVKYLVGNVALIQSIDSVELALEVDRQSKKKGVVTDILIEVNAGKEESKSGYFPEDVESAVKEIAKLENLRIKGLMAMLPKTDETTISKLCLQIRGIYDTIKAQGYPFEHLSMGMSGDYLIAIKNGSNMIRLGSRLFGERNYNKG